jgi:hypothetical protein
LLTTDKYSSTRQAFLFWSNLAKEEQKQCFSGQSKNIIGQYIEQLLNIILQGLSITELDVQHDAEMEEDDDAKWTVMRAALYMLGEVSPLVGDAIFNQVMAFVSERIQKDDWLNQYVGMCALGASLKGPSSSLIYQHCAPLWNGIF